MNILIADDHAIVRRGMNQLLMEKYPFATIGEADNSEELISQALTGEWHVIICDINMPGRSGIDALLQIKEIFPAVPVLIMSMYPEDQYALRVLKAGASGYLGKGSIHDELIIAIETVLKGKKFITQSIAERLAEAVDSNTVKLLHDKLSNREFDVFKLLASGKSVSEIAQKLSLSPTTVSTHRSRIMEKMKLRSNAELARYALENKIL